MNAPENVRSYYDERVAGKIRDFTNPNPRIEAAIETLAHWAPAGPRRVLEIGCGIGATSWRMARAWPHAKVTGLDISPGSIKAARDCFRLPNLNYENRAVSELSLDGEFDLVLMMDVYEHIAPPERAGLHAALRSLMTKEARLIVTVPTPALQASAAANFPEALQPVDESIGWPEMQTLSRETETEILYFRQVGIWNYGDYAHLVLGRFQSLAPVALRSHRQTGMAAIKAVVRRMQGRQTATAGMSDYLGPDCGKSLGQDRVSRFHVAPSERQRLASAWKSRNT